MDALISLAATLFILSMINERIVNFIKLQYSGKKFLFIPMGNLREKGDKPQEEARDKRLILLNIIFGTVIALVIRADLIAILKIPENPAAAIGWKVFKVNPLWNAITLLPGCFLTGCFLSLGSKVWHDLIDLLLQIKDYRKKINELQGMQLVTLTRFDDFIKQNETSVFEDFVKKELAKYKITKYVANLESRSVLAYAPAKVALPPTILYKALNGTVYPIKITEIP